MNQSNFSNFNLKLVLIFSILIILSGCGLVKALRSMNVKDVKPQYFTFKNRSVIFTPLTHFGQKEFYEKLKDSIVHWKNNDYVIFYEGIKHKALDMGVDSITADMTMRKWRKITGGVGASREDYAELSDVFKNRIVQPENEELGIDSTDISADITLIDLVGKFENSYGTVSLDSCDYSTHLDSAYTCSKKQKGKLNPIILDYRNMHLVDQVVKSEHNHIVVLYGGRHIKGMKKLLRDEENTTRE